MTSSRPEVRIRLPPNRHMYKPQREGGKARVEISLKNDPWTGKGEQSVMGPLLNTTICLALFGRF
ncbi:hypothetical protein SESBI_02214 [Sesbania bispinosa]|nr:hypothetical protein SESBI_02214 [Sesbania bispinosa]